MLRTIAALAALTLLAGCIAGPEDPEAIETTEAPEDADRIEGMTAEETITDRDVDCDDGGGISIPRFFCAERVLEVTGLIGLDTLPIDLTGTNGAITIKDSEDDTWSFTATIEVSALTQDMARNALDTAWTWSHETSDGGHALAAGPTPSPNLDTLTTHVRATTYEVKLPAWVAVDVRAITDNGEIVIADRTILDADLETNNGQILANGDIEDFRARTDNGQLIVKLRPISSGTIDLATDNGQIILKVPEDRDHGYDIDASSDNGQVIIGLHTCEQRTNEESSSDYPGNMTTAKCTTADYEKREIQTQIAAESDNGQIIISSG